MFNSQVFFRVTSWLQSESFDACLLPMGQLAYHLAIRPVTEYCISGEGLIARESLPLNLQVQHPFNVMDKFSQWGLMYEMLYSLDPNVHFKLILSVFRDPLLALREFLLRHEDPLLDHRACMAIKYPM